MRHYTWSTHAQHGLDLDDLRCTHDRAWWRRSVPDMLETEPEPEPALPPPSVHKSVELPSPGKMSYVHFRIRAREPSLLPSPRAPQPPPAKRRNVMPSPRAARWGVAQTRTSDNDMLPSPVHDQGRAQPQPPQPRRPQQWDVTAEPAHMLRPGTTAARPDPGPPQLPPLQPTVRASAAVPQPLLRAVRALGSRAASFRAAHLRQAQTTRWRHTPASINAAMIDTGRPPRMGVAVPPTRAIGKGQVPPLLPSLSNNRIINHAMMQ